MVIAIDFDDTYTSDVEMWGDIIRLMQQRGHIAICVSARRNTFENRRVLETSLPDEVKVFLSYDEPKRDFMRRLGYNVDIWIEDSPEAILGV